MSFDDIVLTGKQQAMAIFFVGVCVCVYINFFLSDIGRDTSTIYVCVFLLSVPSFVITIISHFFLFRIPWIIKRISLAQTLLLCCARCGVACV